jgi:osmotically-inducible protein OsmY
MRKLPPGEWGEAEAALGLRSLADAPFNLSFGSSPHRLETAVRRRLLSQPNLRFSSLVIRRIPKGVCLEGVLESDADLDVCNLVRTVAGVDEVLNHLVVRRTAEAR